MAKLNINISDDLMAWLDKRSKEINVTKTALVNLALEQYMQSYVLLSKEKGLSEFIDEMQKLTMAIDKGEIKVVKTKD